MTIATLSTKGWVVIPAEYRQKYGWRAGARLIVVDYGGILSLVPAMEDAIDEAAGILKGGSSLLQALREEHNRELAHEH